MCIIFGQKLYSNLALKYYSSAKAIILNTVTGMVSNDRNMTATCIWWIMSNIVSTTAAIG